MGNVTVAALRMALSSDTETGTWQWTNEVFEAKAKSPIGGGGGSCWMGRQRCGIGQMKRQQVRGHGGVCKSAIVEASLSKRRVISPSLAESLSHGERRKRGSEGP